MAKVIVIADNAAGGTHLCEHVPAREMIDPRAAGGLVERIALALVAAEQSEREPPRLAVARRATT